MRGVGFGFALCVTWNSLAPFVDHRRSAQARVTESHGDLEQVEVPKTCVTCHVSCSTLAQVRAIGRRQ